MKIEDVKNLSPVDRFLYWIKERHNIYLRRKSGKPKPWTDDEILQRFFFTNPYRENDKVTAWFRENVRDPLKDDDRVFMATVIFRWFNYIPTGELLLCRHFPRPVHLSASYLCSWDYDEVLEMLRGVREDKGQVFTGAFMINSPPGKPKLEAICDRIENVWNDREHLASGFSHYGEGEVTMQGVHEALTQYDGLGGFMAYEIVCDLRYTKFLRKAPDKLTWCNPGPGAIRGLYRIAGEDFEKGNNSTSPPRPKDWQPRMQMLLHMARVKLPHMPPFEMREIEHSLCEYDKYSRALEGDGKMKRTYKGV